MAFAIAEQFRQCKPLPGHLVPVVGIHKLIVIHAVWCVSPHLLHCRLAAVQIDDVVDEGLARLGEGNRFGWVGLVVVGWVGLAGLEVLAGGGGGNGGGFDLAVGGRHGGMCCCESADIVGDGCAGVMRVLVVRERL